MIAVPPDKNLISGQLCTPVICQGEGSFFRWTIGGSAFYGDELPDSIVRGLPDGERDRCENHRYRRMGDRP